MTDLHEALRRGRARARYSQDDVGAALGVSRAMVSYWEAGSRAPNDRQLSALARLYGITPADLAEGRDVEPEEIDLAGMLLRADEEIDPGAAPGIREFVDFLQRYAELADLLGIPIRGLAQSPFVHRAKFVQKDDVRRKAEEVRSLVGLGTGPIRDLDPVCELLGITVYRAPLGADLRSAPSGAFLNHPEVGFSILVNLDMTPGRRRFTAAHELAHALFHSNETNRVVSNGRGLARVSPTRSPASSSCRARASAGSSKRSGFLLESSTPQTPSTSSGISASRGRPLSSGYAR
ncbi:MAG: ImmA/IrrE family metallo-endopeptidase [Acidimicrobiia bacterium]|nr:ImmA/IrrE family metallo-endopeptidase [Acidimicrobiia bacterium]